MNRRPFVAWSRCWIGILGLWLSACAAKPEGSMFDTISAANTIRLESSAIAPNSTIPPEYTCDGANYSPDLRWDAPPAETQSFVLVVDDPDAPGQAFAHWLVYNLAPDTRQLAEKLAPQQPISNGGVQGKNDFGDRGYGGPCPPHGTTHRYVFRLYALDTQLDLTPNASKRDVFNAINGHVLATGKITGLFSRP
jgi:Raf kinase inhibitor-like YbhB/YbcL family protein